MNVKTLGDIFLIKDQLIGGLELCVCMGVCV